MRDMVHKCCANAGVQCRTEVPGLLINAGDRPADIFAIMPEGDTAFDVVVTDNRMASSNDATKQERRRKTRVMAKLADRRKRNKAVNGRRLEDVLRTTISNSSHEHLKSVVLNQAIGAKLKKNSVR